MEIPIFCRGGRKDRRSIALATRDGWRIPNELREPAPQRLARVRVEQHMKGHRSVRLRSESTSYNCVGLVFANRRTCVDPEFVLQILRRDGYRPIEIGRARRGDVVLYRAADGDLRHVGILFEREADFRTARWKIRVLSPWGFAGEFFHDLGDVPPIFGEATEAWTDRTLP